jgi:hypothetical protein
VDPADVVTAPELDYGAGRSLLIRHDSKTVPVRDILRKDLSAWAPVPPDNVGVDVRRGHIRIGSAYRLAGPVLVDACYGFSGPIGSGSYARLATQNGGAVVLEVRAQDPAASIKTLEGAVAAWKALPPQRTCGSSSATGDVRP